MNGLARSPSLSSPERHGQADAVICFEDVRLCFGEQCLFDGISFQVSKGATKVLLGEAATGKTTLLKLALGLIRPDAGRIWVCGAEVTRLPEEQLFELRRHIGMVFQESALFDSLSVRENVAFRLIEEQRHDDAEIERRVRIALSFVELEDAIDQMPADLSGGMKRRVSIARALISEPEVMLYDSPTGGLDPITSTTIMELIIKLRDVNHVSALLVTHRLQDAYLMATHVWDPAANQLRPALPDASHTSFLLLRQGQVLFDGSGRELMASRDEYVHTYLS